MIILENNVVTGMNLDNNTLETLGALTETDEVMSYVMDYLLDTETNNAITDALEVL